jgi:hypothetical protein
LVALLKKEIAAGAGGGVREYLQLDRMDDGTDRWMESLMTSFDILDECDGIYILIDVFVLFWFVCDHTLIHPNFGSPFSLLV